MERRQADIIKTLTGYQIEAEPKGLMGGVNLGSGPDNSAMQELAIAFIEAFSHTEPLHMLGGEPIVFEELKPVFRFDLNEFINESDRTRLTHWREQ